MPVVVLRTLLLVAIAFGRTANTAAVSPTVSMSVTITINAGETGVVALCSAAAASGNLATITGISGGGTWTQVDAQNSAAGFSRTDLWTTGAGAATAASSVVISFSGTPASAVAFVSAYTGVQGIGNKGKNTANNALTAVTVTMQDANNWIAGGVGSDQGGTTWPVFTAPATREGTNGTTTGAVDTLAAVGDKTQAGTGSMTLNAPPSIAVNWTAVGVELRSASAGTTYYLNNPVQGGSSAGFLTPAAPTASTSTTGWTVGTTAINQYSRQTYNSEIATTGFTATAQPSGAPVNLGEDCYRSAVTSGTFSAGTWYSSMSVIAVSSGGIQQGRGRFRIWRSTNADGTGATEITQGTMIGSQVTELNTTVAQTSSASTQIGSTVLTNEYLFYQSAWETL